MGNEQSRLIFAVIVSAVILFGWQSFFGTSPEQPQQVTEGSSTQVVAPPVQAPTPQRNDIPAPQKPKLKQSKLELKSYKLRNIRFGLSPDMTIAGIEAAKTRFGFDETLGAGGHVRFSVVENNQEAPLELDFVEKNPNGIIFEDKGRGIRVSIQEDKNEFLKLTFLSQIKYYYRVRFVSSAEEVSPQMLRSFAYYLGKSSERISIEQLSAGETPEVEYEEGPLRWAGIDHHYHLFATFFNQDFISRVTRQSHGVLVVDFMQPTNQFEPNLLFSIKNFDRLQALGNKLEFSVDFGFFRWLAVPILEGLKYFYSFLGNYGWAILFLTFVIRLLTFPLQYKSFKSMKKMQNLQPELAKLKEKYKDDTQKQQRETMELFKRTGVNPLGGCLPILLQLPIFFAFYRVLYEAVELVNAPFYGWIVDLSSKDPYYVLPVLWVILLVLQQKLTPTTITDPTQKKIMTFMPIIFGFFLKDVPSGTALYLVLSSAVGMAQQKLVYYLSDRAEGKLTLNSSTT